MGMTDTTDRFIYAKNVVAQSLKKKPGAWFWYGKLTWSVRLLNLLTGGTIWV